MQKAEKRQRAPLHWVAGQLRVLEKRIAAREDPKLNVSMSPSADPLQADDPWQQTLDSE